MGKGRNRGLIRLRDEALCRRYYELTEKQRLRFDDALKVLSQHEFFLSEERIMAIVRRMVREAPLNPPEGGKKRAHSPEEGWLKPVPKVRMPRLTARQLELFSPTPRPLPRREGRNDGHGGYSWIVKR